MFVVLCKLIWSVRDNVKLDINCISWVDLGVGELL